MVHDDQHGVLVLVQRPKVNSHRHIPGDIETPPRMAIDLRLQGCTVLRPCGEGDARIGGIKDALRQHLFAGIDHCAQAFMAFLQIIQRRFQSRDVQPADQAQSERHVIGGPDAGELLGLPHALLSGGERNPGRPQLSRDRFALAVGAADQRR